MPYPGWLYVDGESGRVTQIAPARRHEQARARGVPTHLSAAALSPAPPNPLANATSPTCATSTSAGSLATARRTSPVGHDQGHHRRPAGPGLAAHWDEHVAPIPDTRSVQRIEENADAVDFPLTGDDLATIDEILPTAASAPATPRIMRPSGSESAPGPEPSFPTDTAGTLTRGHLPARDGQRTTENHVDNFGSPAHPGRSAGSDTGAASIGSGSVHVTAHAFHPVRPSANRVRVRTRLPPDHGRSAHYNTSPGAVC